MPIDLDRLRAETPGSDHVAHLNNAGAALPPQVVTETVVAHLRPEASRSCGASGATSSTSCSSTTTPTADRPGPAGA